MTETRIWSYDGVLSVIRTEKKFSDVIFQVLGHQQFIHLAGDYITSWLFGPVHVKQQ